MVAAINFYAGETTNINNLSGSGLGFFGSGGFGNSVTVGGFQGSTFITDGNGTIQGSQTDNTSWSHPNSGTTNGAGPYALTFIPNYLSTLNITFTNDTAVTTQNAELRIYDRTGINNDPSGVTCYVAELIHPNTTVSAGGSGDTSWIQAHGSGVTVDLVASPGESGLSPNGPSTSDTKHDHYVVISASPDSIGSKTLFGLYYSVEYLIWAGLMCMLVL